MILRTAAWPATLLLALMACSLVACQSDAGAPPLQGSTIGGPFALTDHEGRRVSDQSYAGRYRLMYFGFANCPDVCPTDLQVLGAGLRRFEADTPTRAARVQPIFVSVDPARDTPEVLRRYVANFHPRLVGLTGSVAEVEAAKREYGVFSQNGPADAQGGYTVDHNRVALLFGTAGEPIAIVPHDEGPEAVAAELARWVR